MIDVKREREREVFGKNTSNRDVRVNKGDRREKLSSKHVIDVTVVSNSSSLFSIILLA